jgi:hypothetical protein
MPMRQMFELIADHSATLPAPLPMQRAADAPEPAELPAIPIQLDPAPAAPASTTVAPSAPATQSPGDIEALAHKLYEPLTARIKAELWLDRERAGALTDPRF